MDAVAAVDKVAENSCDVHRLLHHLGDAADDVCVAGAHHPSHLLEVERNVYDVFILGKHDKHNCVPGKEQTIAVSEDFSFTEKRPAAEEIGHSQLVRIV